MHVGKKLKIRIWCRCRINWIWTRFQRI